MLGYDISWAAFNIIEVMSCTKFTVKVKVISKLSQYTFARVHQPGSQWEDQHKVFVLVLNSMTRTATSSVLG